MRLIFATSLLLLCGCSQSIKPYVTWKCVSGNSGNCEYKYLLEPTRKELKIMRLDKDNMLPKSEQYFIDCNPETGEISSMREHGEVQ